jgi:hypothetical protein
MISRKEKGFWCSINGDNVKPRDEGLQDDRSLV